VRSYLALSCLAVILLSFYACKKNELPAGPASHLPVTKPPATTVDPGKQLLATTSYPYTDTFYGPYSEYNPLSPENLSGYSTVIVQHVNADSIIITADSIGGPRPDYIYVHTHTNPANSYTIKVQWFSDRCNFYTCTFANDTLHADIVQNTACSGNFGYFVGYYTGHKK
jgi:hypothetical protein